MQEKSNISQTKVIKKSIIQKKEGAIIANNLRKLRKQRKLTSDDIQKQTQINRGTYNNYENGTTEPKPETWQALADYFNVSVPYLQGAYSKDEVLAVLQKYYSKYADDNFDITIDTLRNLVYFDIGEVVDEFVISKGLKPWNIKKEAPLLSKEEVTNTTTR